MFCQFIKKVYLCNAFQKREVFDIVLLRGIAQLVAFLVWDQAVACSSHAAPTKHLNLRGIAQLVAFLVWDQAVACSSHAAPTF